MSDYLYHDLEMSLRKKILQGSYPPASKLPSIRQMCLQVNVSKTTVLSAYTRLEAQGLIEARDRSGYYVRSAINLQNSHRTSLKQPNTSQPIMTPVLISRTQVFLDIMHRGAVFDLISPGQDVPANTQLRRCLSKGMRQQNSSQQLNYDQPRGNRELINQICNNTNLGAGSMQPEDVIISNGCQHALLLAIIATTEPNDIIAIESPAFYGALQLIEVLGRKVLEISSSTDSGLNLETLAQAAANWDIRAIIVSPAFSTPTGACMPEQNKITLLAIAAQHMFTIIEDDIYASLYFRFEKPRSIYSYDTQGLVILCSSLSKSVSRDLRIGWIASKKYSQKILALKIATVMASSASQQQGLSYYIKEGHLDRHLKQRRQLLESQKNQLLTLIQQHMSHAISVSQPHGGLVLWLELGNDIDTMALYKKAREQGITITPGSLFSAQNTYQSYLRVSFSQPWSEERRAAFKLLAKLTKA
jgi:DNA-binding transcriptional MocR family regulator